MNNHLATPQFVKFDDDIIDISAGEWHALALSVKGEVYAWGLSNHTALTDDLVACQLPAKIKTLPSVVKLFTTPHSTINVVKTASGAWYGWGSESSPNMIPTKNNRGKDVQKIIGMDSVESVVCSPWAVFFFLEKHKASIRRIERFSDVVLLLQQ
jgi:alpha-tubulin suppressor-like RCC1 family protein